MVVTRHDKARADYREGDAVAFTRPDGPGCGEIVKLNPKTAKVRCEETYWNVSYGLLRRSGGENARNGAERLNGVAGMARRLTDKHGLTGWTLAFVEAKRRLGDCHYRHRAARDCTRDRGTRGGPWTAVEGNGPANRSNAKGEDLREPSKRRQG